MVRGRGEGRTYTYISLPISDVIYLTRIVRTLASLVLSPYFKVSQRLGAVALGFERLSLPEDRLDVVGLQLDDGVAGLDGLVVGQQLHLRRRQVVVDFHLFVEQLLELRRRRGTVGTAWTDG